MTSTVELSPAPEQQAHPWIVPTPEALESWVRGALGRHMMLVANITADGAPRTLETSLRHYDDAVAILSATGSQLGLLNSVHPDRDVRDTAQVQIQNVAQAGVALSLNRDVYAALSEVPLADADPATRHYLERTLLSYRLSGVDKDEATRAKLRGLHERATVLSLQFGRNVQESIGTVIVEDAGELAGLPPDYREQHAPGADGTTTLTTAFPDYLPVMTFAESAELRRRMFLAYQTRAFPENVEVLQELLAVRHEIAGLLGFRNWADLATADQMMESSTKMQGFIDELDRATRAGAKEEYAAVLAFARAHGLGEKENIDAAGRGFWLEQYRRAAFSFDSQEVRPYFPFQAVQQGVLDLVAEIFGVRFASVEDADTWHEDVTTWDVFNARGDREKLGRFYLDMHPREGKDKWFSAAPLIPGVRGARLPEAALICNFAQPKQGEPALLQYSDVTTFLHEFGHLMHAILGGGQAWAGLSGIATEGDFVEVPSQMLEEFFRDPKLLQRFARHYQTGEPIPTGLVERMNKAGAFGRADSVRTQLFYTSYSLDTHRLAPSELDLEKLLREDYARFLPYAWVDGNRLYASFTHLTGYSSNYYTYLYDKVIALDFFREFAAGELAAVSERYREEVIAPGGSKPGKELVRAFLGREQSPEAFTDWLEEAIPR